MAPDVYDLELMLRGLNRIYGSWGLKINNDKFKILGDNYSVNQAEQFKYLGVIITSNGMD